MLVKTVLPRLFLHRENGQELELADPGIEMSPEAVLNFYSGTYPILAAARIEGPEIKNDKVVYRFVSTMGTKG